MWGQSLAGLQGNEIKHGVEYCRANHKWPPTIAEFIAACKSAPKPFVSLPSPKGISNEDGIKRVESVLKGLRQNKPIDGRAYWRKVLDDPTTKPGTRQFAHEALANLNGANR